MLMKKWGESSSVFQLVITLLVVLTATVSGSGSALSSASPPSWGTLSVGGDVSFWEVITPYSFDATLESGAVVISGVRSGGGDWVDISTWPFLRSRDRFDGDRSIKVNSNLVGGAGTGYETGLVLRQDDQNLIKFVQLFDAGASKNVSGQVSFRVSGAWNHLFFNNTTIQPGVWRSYEIVHRAGGPTDFYLDGDYQGSVSFSLSGFNIELLARVRQPGDSIMAKFDDVEVDNSSYSNFGDVLPPVTTEELSGTEGTFGWYVTPVEVSLVASDNETWVTSTTYRLDGGAWNTYSGPFDVGEGEQLVEFRSVDVAGNQESASNVTLRVDLGAPETLASINGTVGQNDWFAFPVSMILNSSDSVSGLHNTSYRVDGGTWETYFGPVSLDNDGIHNVDFFATDLAGNAEAMKTTEVKIDSSVPSTFANVAGTTGSQGWYIADVEVTLIATDATSGVAWTRYRLGEGAWQTYTGPFAMDLDGTVMVEFDSTDVAGNREPTKAIDVRIDTMPPVTLLELMGEEGEQDWFTSPVILNLTSFDDGSGVELVLYRINGGPWLEFDQPVVIEGTGVHSLAFHGADMAGNVESIQSLELKIDTSSPEIEFTFPLEGVWRKESSISIHWALGDEGSGLLGAEVQIDGGNPIDPEGNSLALTGLSDGLHVVVVRAFDGAGNVAERRFEFGVDAVPPGITIEEPSSGGIQTSSRVTVRWTVDENISPSFSCEISLDDRDPGSLNDQDSYTFTDLTDGDHEITVHCTDLAGNTAEAGVRFVVDTNVLSPTGPAGIWLLASVFVAILASIAIALAYLIRKGRQD